MLLSYVNHVESYLNNNIRPYAEGRLFEYLQSQITVALAQAEISARPMVHTFKSMMHLNLLDTHMGDELDGMDKRLVESWWKEALKFADLQDLSVSLHKFQATANVAVG